MATDIAARGIDVKNIEIVVNYDLPDDADNYVHRIGRTARAGMEGKAISFATPDQFEEVRNIQKLVRIDIPISTHPEVPAQDFWLKPPSVNAVRPGPKKFGGGARSFSGRSFGGGGRFRRR